MLGGMHKPIATNKDSAIYGENDLIVFFLYYTLMNDDR